MAPPKPHTALVKDITSLEQLQEAICESKIVVVYCYAPWCCYCRLMTPCIERAAASNEVESIMFYKANTDELEEMFSEYNMSGIPNTFVYRLGKLFRFFGGAAEEFEPWFASVLSASERAVDGSVVSHQDLLQGDSPSITEITSIEAFRSITSSACVVLYLYSTESSVHEDLSPLFECAAVSCYGNLEYCVLNGDMHAEIVKDLELETVTGAICLYWGKMLGSSQATFWGTFTGWLDSVNSAAELAGSLTPPVLSSDQRTCEITEIASLEQFQEIVSTHKHVAVTFYYDMWPYSEALLLVFERAAAEDTFKDIHFAKVDIQEQEDIVDSLGIEGSEIRVFSDGEGNTLEFEASTAFDNLKEELLRHINPDEYTAEADANSSDELNSEEAPNLDEDVPDTSSNVTLEQRSSDELNSDEAHNVNVDLPDTSSNVTLEQRSSDELNSEEAHNPDVDVPDTSSNVTLELRSSDESEKVILPEAINAEELKIVQVIHSPPANAGHGSESKISLASQAPTFIIDRSTCEGHAQTRGKRPLYQRLLQKPKPFSDQESGCVFIPNSKQDRLQVGQANEAISMFGIALSCESHQDGETEIQFHISFAPDRNVGARFHSALFEVSFYQHSDDGTRRLLNVRDFQPKDEVGKGSEVHIRKNLEASMGVKGGASFVSLETAATGSTTEEYTKKTASRVQGANTHTSTVRWTFQEDAGHAAEGGLETHYMVCARVPRAEIMSIRFWAKAILGLVRGPKSKVELNMGTMESLYEKALYLRDLHPEET